MEGCPVIVFDLDVFSPKTPHVTEKFHKPPLSLLVVNLGETLFSMCE